MINSITLITIPIIVIIANEAAQNKVNRLDRLINIAKLHNNPTTQLDNQKNLYQCIVYQTDTTFNWKNSLQVCDDEITNSIISHDFGTNQTVLNHAHQYLSQRGIK